MTVADAVAVAPLATSVATSANVYVAPARRAPPLIVRNGLSTTVALVTVGLDKSTAGPDTVNQRVVTCRPGAAAVTLAVRANGRLELTSVCGASVRVTNGVELLDCTTTDPNAVALRLPLVIVILIE